MKTTTSGRLQGATIVCEIADGERGLSAVVTQVGVAIAFDESPLDVLRTAKED